jgi:hypothetical protein
VGFEFPPLGESADAPEEQLETPRHSRWLSGWWLLVALLIVAGLVGALTRPGPSPERRSAPAPTVSEDLQPACPGVARRVVRAAVPPSITRLARADLPPGARLRVRTVFAAGPAARPHTIVERDIDASVDSVTVLIRVQRCGPGTQQLAPDPAGVGSLLLHQHNSGFVVRLQYLAPETVPPMLARLQALMGDPRLVSA